MAGFLLLALAALVVAVMSATAYWQGNTRRATILSSVLVAVLMLTALLIWSLKHFGEAPRN